VIRFSDKQWDNVIDNYRKWWKGELGRPILPLIITGADPGRPEPKAPRLSFSNCSDLSIPAEAIIDRMDYDFSSYEFYGDSFPCIAMHQFGAGVAAAFLGSRLDNADDTVWFHPLPDIPIEELHLTYDAENIWFRRIKDLYQAGVKKWGDSVCLAMTDIGGTMDILASLLGTEKLLFELNDNPKEVLRLCNEISDLWMKFFKELGEIIRGQRVFSDWSAILSEQPTYMLQCDFCYMIGPQMFKQFIYDDLSKTAAVLDKPFYHLDGIGELVHLDHLLSIDSIKGIQWIPGAGDPEMQDWSELYSKISASGKKIMAPSWPGKLDKYLDEIINVTKKPDEIMKMQMHYSQDEKEEAVKKLAGYGAV